MEVLSTWAQGTEGIEVQGHNDIVDLLTRDTNVEEYRYTPGIYSDVSATDAMRRRSGARQYINTTIAAGHPLTLSTHSLATKIVFEQSQGEPKAVGVEYLVGEALYGADRRYNPAQNGTLRVASATSEVIIAGGAFNTPQLLKLSGIGPHEELEAFGIATVVDLPAVVSRQNLSSPLVLCFAVQICILTNIPHRAQTYTTTPKAFTASTPRRLGKTLWVRLAMPHSARKILVSWSGRNLAPDRMVTLAPPYVSASVPALAQLIRSMYGLSARQAFFSVVSTPATQMERQRLKAGPCR